MKIRIERFCLLPAIALLLVLQLTLLAQSSGEWHFVSTQRWDKTKSGTAAGDGAVTIKVIRFDERGGEAQAHIELSQSACARGGLEAAPGAKGETEIIGFKWTFPSPILRLRPGDSVPVKVETWLEKASKRCPNAAAVRSQVWVTQSDGSTLWGIIPDSQRGLYWGHFSHRPDPVPGGIRWNFEPSRSDASGGSSQLRIVNRAPASSEPQRGWLAINFSTNAATVVGDSAGFFYIYEFGTTDKPLTNNLAGDWESIDRGTWRPTTIRQEGNKLWFTNEHGKTSAGFIESSTRVKATEWQGGLGATIQNGDTIKWDNGSTWRRRAGCRLDGTWKQTTQGVGTSNWIITETGKAAESGLGGATGSASLSGSVLRIDWSHSNGWSGTYEWSLNSNCSSNSGKLVFKSGGSGTRSSSVARQ